ncbi:hypothetical protein ACFQY5_35915 [Paeniroseomonas aquatica]|uniref:Uncharacterized protein n=1 Tax=Paeniroseomonas aquatica TaxID=373043 RepID=A0ABT8AH83_9PROT|nr:hypothetical protein [Paeniroseomonas aquatica]MDN3568724.1 hypothetical protein [Paeniroseomonas aquatica]
MFQELRYHLTPKRMLTATAVLAGLTLLIPWMPTYAPIREAMTRHHLEAMGRAPAQVQARSAAQRRAAEEAAQRRMAEEREQAQQRTLQATAREHAQLVSSFNALANSNLVAFNQTVNPAGELMLRLKEFAQNASYYRTTGITPEETATRRPCSDPATTSDLLNRDQRRRRNIIACAVYMVNSFGVSSDPIHDRLLNVALLYRMDQPTTAQTFPLPVLVSYAWIGSNFRSNLYRARDVPALPPLLQGDQLNPRLLEGFLAPGFAQRLFETATIEEKLAFTRTAYPDLVKMSELAQRILPLCRARQLSDCLEPG